MANYQLTLDDITSNLPPVDEARADKELRRELDAFDRKIIVLDDDPTGTQAIHGVPEYTDWSLENIDAGFAEKYPMFFILTNSRGFTAAETEAAHREIALNILKVSKKHNKDFIIVIRSDSTLRGHYPLETAILKETIEANSAMRFDGEIILPFFKEGGRFTINNIQYVQEGQYLTPAADTEFAGDKTFGYTQSHLGRWIEEKSQGKFKAVDAAYIPLDIVRKPDVEAITEELLKVSRFNKVIVNAVDYADVKIFAAALLRTIKAGRNFIFRTAASFTKVIGGIADRGLLSKEELVRDNDAGGLIIVGSHVKRTSEQLEELKKCSFIEFVEFDQHLVLQPDKLEKEIERAADICEKNMAAGKTTAVYTRRERLDTGTGSKDDELKISLKISDAVTEIVRRLKIRPSYIITKGGNTSSNIAGKGLGIKRAFAAGQIKPGIPVWITGNESRFPGMPLVIFPGNVGSRTTLKEIADILQ